MKRKLIIILTLVIFASSLLAANMKVAILDFAKKDRNSDYVAMSMMKRDFKKIFKEIDDLELIDIKKSQQLALKAGYSSLFFAELEEIKAMGTELGADIVVWGEVSEKASEKFKILVKILSMKSDDVAQISFDVTKSSRPRQDAIKQHLIAKINEFCGGEVDKLFGIATQYFNSKNYPSAEEAFLALIEVEPKHSDSYFYLGLIKFLTKDYETSVEYYNKGLEVDPENEDLLNYLSKSYLKMNEPESAVEALVKITEIKEDKELWLRIGLIYTGIEYYEEAVEAYQAAIEIDEEYGEAYKELAITYYEQELYDDAIKPFEFASKAFPEDDKIQKKLAKCYNKTGKIESAIAQYIGIIEEQKDNVKAYMSLANAYIATEQYDKALKTAQDLKEITPDNPKTLVLVANAYNLLKQYNNAQTAAEAALKIDENLYQPYRIISEIKFAKGYLKYEKFLKLEEEAKNVYGAEADRLVEERDAVKKEANDLFIASQNYLDKAKERTESSSELRYIKARKATLKQLLEATEKGFF